MDAIVPVHITMIILLLITTGDTHKRGMISQTIIPSFQKVLGGRSKRKMMATPKWVPFL